MKTETRTQTIGGRLQALRLKRGLTPTDVAKAIQISRQSVYNWESNERLPDIPHLQALCDLYMVESREILGF